MGFAVGGCWRLQAFLDCFDWCQRRYRKVSKRQQESNEAKCITELSVLFFSGEEVAKIEICSDWTALALKKAIRPFLGKGSAVSALIHEGEVLADTDSLEHLKSHVHVTLRKCAFLVEGAGAETVNGFYVRTKGCGGAKSGLGWLCNR
eukprot:symbB.v1.2.025727.t1/scaffold2516.1/size77141/2